MSELLVAPEADIKTEPERITGGARWSKGMVLAYGATIFLSAFLLFQVQLVIGKFILPLFGGAPAVWNTCMFCFQVLLLLGYGYAHGLSSFVGVRRQGKVHGFVLITSAVILVILWMKWGTPLTPGSEWSAAAEDNPVWKILELLAATVALPFFVLSTTGPLLQKWFSRNHPSAYRLYALSNAGSLVGLLSYPFFVEWAFDLKHQAWIWSAGYLVFAALCVGIAWRSLSQNGDFEAAVDRTEEEQTACRPSGSYFALWLGLSSCSTTVLLATTNLFCQDLAAIPLLWVLPLSVYLLSFMITFDHKRWYRRSVFWPLYFVALGLGTGPELLGYNRIPLVYAVAVCGVSLFAVCMVCHGELARSKPAREYLTSFYVTVASGGALGGAFVVLLAPRMFRGFFEYQTGLVACGFLLFVAFLLEDRSGRGERQLWNLTLVISAGFFLPYLISMIGGRATGLTWGRAYFTVPLCVATFFLVQSGRRKAKQSADEAEVGGFPWPPVASLLTIGVFGIVVYGFTQTKAAHTLFQVRNFFGVKYVTKTFINMRGAGTPDEELIVLINGSTIHGAEFTARTQRNYPTTYYGTASGIGLLLGNHPRTGGNGSLRMGLVGMGAGTLSTYGREGDSLLFYEIDPAVIALSAGENRYFHFLEDTRAQVEIVPGDARLSLEKEAREGKLRNFDVLVLDAFTSDSIPVHLLTAEAMKLYRKHLRNENSVIAFNISNWYLDLRPVVAGLAEQNGLNAVRVRSQASEWVLLCANPAMLRLPNLLERSAPLDLKGRRVLWTDDYSNLFQILRAPGWATPPG